MRIEILSIGGELLEGLTVNTNAFFLSQKLREKGYSVEKHIVIGDNLQTIRENVDEALSRSDLVITTGGLGPTIDDLTKLALNDYVEKSVPLKNSVGAAQGVFYFSEGKGLVLLPGVSREMETMFLSEALPLIAKKFQPKKRFRHTFSLCLFKEMEINPYLIDLTNEHPEIECGIYPSMGTLQISLSSEKPLEEIGKKFEEKFPTFVFPEKKIEEAVHREFLHAKKSVAFAESCTGGALSSRITLIPDASYFFQGSIVSYSNRWKERFLHVSPKTLQDKGAVSLEAVEEMIQGLFRDSDVDYAVAISGIAGPGGGTLDKPVGTIYVGVGKRGERSDIGLIKAPNDRASAIDLAVQTALSVLWRRLVHNTSTFS